MRITAAELTELGVTQLGNPILNTVTQAFDLPHEREEAQRLWLRLDEFGREIRSRHPSDKGLGIAANQIGVPRRLSWFLKDDKSEPLALLNAHVLRKSDENDVKYEGCLSFHDVRGLVQRPLEIEVEFANFDGVVSKITLRDADARLACHEIDHLDGLIYKDRMAEGLEIISYEEYAKDGSPQPWTYGSN